MKIDRLIGILTILLQNNQVTAPYLAEKFEVSRRTITRDIDALCRAGVPLVTRQGGNGGISIIEGYKINNSLLTADELQAMIAGLKSIDSVSPKSNLEKILMKLAPGNQALVSLKEPVVIDLSSYYKDSLSKKIEMFKQGIFDRRLARFDYYSEKGQAMRTIEPYFIAFKWSAWYVFGYCTQRQDYRMFKLNRLWNLSLCAEYFASREIPEEKANLDAWQMDDHHIVIEFDESVKYLIVEAYGPNCYTETDDGKLRYEGYYTKKSFILSWIFSFGDKVSVIEPKELRDEIRQIAQKIVNNNSEQDI